MHVFVPLPQIESFKKEMATFYTKERTPHEVSSRQGIIKQYLSTVICGKNHCIIASVRGRFLMY